MSHHFGGNKKKQDTKAFFKCKKNFYYILKSTYCITIVQ